MYGEQNGHGPARTELRRTLSDGLARARWTKTQLAQNVGLSRTTVQLAFQAGGKVPSAETVAALARALKLPVGELLELQRAAAAEESGSDTADRLGPGRPIGQWEPHELEVHPAGSATGSSTDTSSARALPGYVQRGHDQVLADVVRDAAAGRSRLMVLVGTSSTGKTRACWEAVQPLAEKGWRLWHPFDPTRAEAALEELRRVLPHTVVWLNEAQHYFGDQAAGELIAAAVHQLLLDEERGPVLILGTLWPEYAHRYTTLPVPGGPDPHSRVRELLAGRTQAVPDTFDTAALAAAAALADDGDRLLADALIGARDDGRITQDLAGAPELLRRYEQATPPARALLEAAMDARRLGVGLHLPQAFLTDAATDYLTDPDYDQLTDDWAELAFAELAELVHGKQAPLRRATPRPPRRPPVPTTTTNHPAPPPTGPVFRLADYLEQHGRIIRHPLCPPASFWHSAHTHLTHPDDLRILTHAARSRYRLQWAHHLQRRAADRGDIWALLDLAWLREGAGDREGAEALARQAADRGDFEVLWRLAWRREEAGDREGAEALYRQAADRGDSEALRRLAWLREEAGDREGAAALYRQAADRGDIEALRRLAWRREGSGDREGAEALYRQAADRGDSEALCCLARLREVSGDRDGAEALARQAADRGDAEVLLRLARLREEAGDWDGAEALARQAADRGDSDALVRLAQLREMAGDRDGAEALYRQAADRGDTDALWRLAWLREGTGDREGAEALYRQAADRGDSWALVRLAWLREGSGDREGAEVLVRQAADCGDIGALMRLAWLREGSGDREGAEVLVRQAVDRGDSEALRHVDRLARLWPYGLDPDGTPTPRWQ